MMKRKLILFALLIMATGLRAQTLVLHHTNVELSKNFRKYVTDEDYVFTLKDVKLTFSRSDISYHTIDHKKGDVNRDGDVGIGDIVAITNVMAGIETNPDIVARADVNEDGSVGIGDIVAVTNIMAGIDTDDEEEAYVSCPDDSHPHWIDMGLPSGTKWACCNVGASAPEEYGGYYTFDQAKAYNPPSLEQIDDLVNNCSYTWTTQNGVTGGKFTGPNGGTIFLPAAGYRWIGEFNIVGSGGGYWSSTPYDEDCAYALVFDSYEAWYSGRGWRRDRELSVRPVR